MRRYAVPTAILVIGTMAGTLAFAQKQPPKPKSNAEIQALQALFGAQTPDARIKAADDLITKFADTDFKSIALQAEAEGYQQKGDSTKAVVFGEQALAADPANFDAMTLLANVISSSTRDTDLDKAEKLTRADKYANDAINALKTVAKPNPSLADEQWAQYKKGAEAQAWQALGNSAVIRKKFDEATADYQKALDLTPDPYIMIRVGRAMLTAHKPDEAITWFDKAAAAPNADAQVKQIAASDKARATAAKAGPKPAAAAPGATPGVTPGANPAAPPAPQPVQIKPQQ